jgi:hypothetical protein
MQGHGEHSGGSVGLTDHTPPDLDGTVTLLPLALQTAGKDKKGLSGGLGAKPPAIRAPKCAYAVGLPVASCGERMTIVREKYDEQT